MKKLVIVFILIFSTVGYSQIIQNLEQRETILDLQKK